MDAKLRIQNNFDNETNPPKGTREGFNVAYSKTISFGQLILPDI